MLNLRFSESELEARREHIVEFIRSTADAAGV